jgi:prepilin-type N-terminal cleavage/methylation domain-containing protein
VDRRAGARPNGFTLLEVLISMAVTAFGILGFSGLLKVIGDAAAEDTWATRALFCAQERVEEIKFDFLTGYGLAGEGQQEWSEGWNQGLRRKWSVAPSAVFDGLMEIGVECSYPWKGGRKAVTLSTLVVAEE